MTAVPEPVPLDLPPGDVGGLEDVVEDVAGTAYWLTVLSNDLSGPAATAPGWLGDDAAAAAAQVGAVAGLTRECSAAVGAAAHRLRLHHDLLREVRRQIDTLRMEQDDDYAAAGRQLTALGVADGLAVSPERDAVIERLRTAEAARRSQHAALLAEVAGDAAATVAVLADASTLIGGRGTRGDGERVLVHLAAELPGWGDRELTALGAALAADLADGSSPSERNGLARRALALTGSPVFAEALLVALGPTGVRVLLHDLGDGVLGPGSPVAQVVAAAFGTASAGRGSPEPLDRVLTAQYLEAAGAGRDRDLVMFGMAAVLAASATLPSGGLQQRTVVSWSRQIVAAERDPGDDLGGREYPTTGTVDPLAAVVSALEDLGSPSAAAAVLGEPAAWTLLLGRSWADGGAALAEVAALAGAHDGPDGDRATRLGLEALGHGLADGDPDGWTVDRAVAAVVSPALASAVAQHVTVLTGVLGLGLDEELGTRAGDLLRGLGYLTLDEGASRTVRTALVDWVRIQPVPPALDGGPLPPPVVVVPSAYLAVQEYGQRLAHALHGFEQQAEAEHDERVWNWTVGLLAETLRRTPASVAASVLEGYAAMATGNDGRWENGADGGKRFDGDDAAAAVLRLTPGVDDGVRGVLAGSARAVFDRTSEALGNPRPPVPEEFDGLGPIKDAGVGIVEDKALALLGRGVHNWTSWDLQDELHVLLTAVHPFR